MNGTLEQIREGHEAFHDRLVGSSIMPLILDGRDYFEQDTREPEVPVVRRVLQACKVVRP